jgi:hypothetical protein
MLVFSSAVGVAIARHAEPGSIPFPIVVAGGSMDRVLQ